MHSNSTSPNRLVAYCLVRGKRHVIKSKPSALFPETQKKTRVFFKQVSETKDSRGCDPESKRSPAQLGDVVTYKCITLGNLFTSLGHDATLFQNRHGGVELTYIVRRLHNTNEEHIYSKFNIKRRGQVC